VNWELTSEIGKKRSLYRRYSPEERFQIDQYTTDHGIEAAAKCTGKCGSLKCSMLVRTSPFLTHYKFFIDELYYEN